jgi:aromatic ring-cleaving dioxygenase
MDSLPNSVTDIIEKSQAYVKFPNPITSNFIVGGFDAHVQFSVKLQVDYAKQLYDHIQYEFLELRIYHLFKHPARPFTTGSFEGSLQSLLELGTLTAWPTVHRGPLSVLTHLNTEADVTGETS